MWNFVKLLFHIHCILNTSDIVELFSQSDMRKCWEREATLKYSLWLVISTDSAINLTGNWELIVKSSIARSALLLLSLLLLLLYNLLSRETREKKREKMLYQNMFQQQQSPKPGVSSLPTEILNSSKAQIQWVSYVHCNGIVLYRNDGIISNQFWLLVFSRRNI